MRIDIGPSDSEMTGGGGPLLLDDLRTTESPEGTRYWVCVTISPRLMCVAHWT